MRRRKRSLRMFVGMPSGERSNSENRVLPSRRSRTTGRPILFIVLVLMASDRAMTLAFLHRVGDGGPGDPPDAWLMPLVGEAIVGIGALVVAALLWFRPSPLSWLIAVVWTVVAAFDAFAAWLVEISTPWPDFFMLGLLGRAMFPAAIVLHVVILGLLMQPEIRDRHVVVTEPSAT